MSEDEDREELEEEEEAEEEGDPFSAGMKEAAAEKPIRVARPRRQRQAQVLEAAPDLDEEDKNLLRLVNVVQTAKRQKMNERRAMEAVRELKELLGTLDDLSFRQIMADEGLQDVITHASQVSGIKPGEPIYDDKGREISRVPYTYDDFCKMYPMHTWVPRRNDVIDVNGVALQVWEGLETRAPKIFYDVQEESIRSTEAAVRRQRETLENSPARYADGTSLEVGWQKAEITANTPGWHEA